MLSLIRLINPLNGLLLLVLIHTAGSAAMIYYGEYASPEAGTVYTLGYILMLMWWVRGDRRARRFSAPFEFEAFVFFAWPVVLPAYLFSTRGWRAIPACIALAMLIFLPYLVEMAAYKLFWV